MGKKKHRSLGTLGFSTMEPGESDFTHFYQEMKKPFSIIMKYLLVLKKEQLFFFICVVHVTLSCEMIYIYIHVFHLFCAFLNSIHFVPFIVYYI
mmetsp:Transcript_43759/g.71638  ORF Transcript_43759/g.71638 Transcript_43759/m.71638 type:complete len:94 (-) Transcript_43759:270-551(-)